MASPTRRLADSILVAVAVTVGAIACGESVASRAEAPNRPQERAPESPRGEWSSTPSGPIGPRVAVPLGPEQAPVAEPPVRQGPLPAPGGDLSLREAYARTEAEIARASDLLNRNNREVVARYGRNDTPEALQVLAPIRDRLQQARRHLEHLTCRDQPIGDVRRELKQRRIPLDGFRVDRRWLDAYITAKLADGDIGATRAEDLRFVLSKSGHGVMNPSSRGAHTINVRVVQALACFGLSGPSRSPMRLPPERPPAPEPSVDSQFRFFRTCKMRSRLVTPLPSSRQAKVVG